MASTATTGANWGNRTNVVHVLGERVAPRSNSNVTPIVFHIGGDRSEHESLRSLIGREGWQLETFESAREFLARPRPVAPSCIILGLSPLDPNRLEVQRQLSRERAEVPIIVLSTYGDVPTTVQAIKAGAVDFLLKPFNSAILLEGIREGFERSRMVLDREMEIRDLRSCYASLSSRERQVMALVVSGLLNKQVGGELGIGESTVKAHRGRVMEKMKAHSLADLVRIASKLVPLRRAISAA